MKNSPTETISISIPSDLLEEVDFYCSNSDLNRSGLITRSIRKYLIAQYDSPILWQYIKQIRDESPTRNY